MWRLICFRLPSMPRRVLLRRVLPVVLAAAAMAFLALQGVFDLVPVPHAPSSLALDLHALERDAGRASRNATPPDDFPFEFLINEPEFCRSKEDLDVINFVGVAPWEKSARERIRRLWGNSTWRSVSGFSTVFLVGTTEEEGVMEAVQKESQVFRDIIQVSFRDTYDNLTLKTLSGFHWVDRYCPNPTWVLKSDADVVVNVFELKDFLTQYDERTNGTRHQLICKRRHSLSPCRKSCRHKKWQVSWEEYPHPRYPSYCQGPGYIIPRRLVGTIYRAANKTHPFRMEDVYYTGILADKLGITKLSIAHRFPWRPRAWQDSFVTTDIMILELDKGVGRGASTLVWSNILHNRGFKDESCANVTGNYKVPGLPSAS
nr:beta-1,3-galactosyltransferase 5-like [Penaeus vannamei]